MLLLILLLPSPAPAQEKDPAIAAPPDGKVSENVVEAKPTTSTDAESAREAAAKVDRRLSELDDQINEREKELDQLRQEIKGIPPEQIGTAITSELERLQAELSTLRKSFEQIALGGLDVSPLRQEPDKAYDWQAELLEVVRPVLASLKDLTDKPRRIEATRQRIAQLESQIKIADEAVRSLTRLLAHVGDKDVKDELRKMAHTWDSRRTDFENQADVARFQLAALQEDRRSSWEIVSEALQQFVAGRGLTLLIALAAAIVIWLLIRLVVLIMRRLRTNTSRKTRRRRERAMYY